MQLKNSARMADAGLMIILFVFSFITAMTVLSKNNQQSYYQYLFEPAVMLACDHGFIRAADPPNPALNDFLAVKSATFDCRYLPKNIVAVAYPAVQAWYYMLFFTAVIWKIFGISWQNVNILISLLFSSTILFSYGLYRLGMGRWLAAIGAIIFCLCAQHLAVLPYFRDYTAAPFILGSLFFIGLLITKHFSCYQQLSLSAVLGVFLGIGYGFRTDVIVVLPYMVLVFLLFLPNGMTLGQKAGGHPQGVPLQWKIGGFLIRVGCALTCLLCFRLTILPITAMYRHTQMASPLFHFLLLGLTTTHTAFLELTPSLYYDWGYLFSDAFIFAMTTAHGHYTLGLSPIFYYGPMYGLAGFDLFKTICFTFPADMVLRGLSAITHILTSLPTIDFFGHTFSMPRNTWIFTPIAIVMICFYQLRLGIFLILTLSYFMAYPGLVFQERHYFYLFFWWWWPIGFCFSMCYFFFTRQSWQAGARLKFKTHLNKVLGLLVVLSLGLWLTVSLLREYQFREVKPLIQAYLAAPVKNIAYTQEKKPEQDKMYFSIAKKTIFAPLLGTKNAVVPENALISYIYNSNYFAKNMGAKMLVISIDTMKCHDMILPLEIVYAFPKTAGEFNFTRTVTLSLEHASTVAHRFFSPIYYADQTQAGESYYPYAVTLPLNQAACLQNIAYVLDPHFYPLWLSLDVPSDWMKKNFYLRFK